MLVCTSPQAARRNFTALFFYPDVRMFAINEFLGDTLLLHQQPRLAVLFVAHRDLNDFAIPPKTCFQVVVCDKLWQAANEDTARNEFVSGLSR